MPLLLLIVFLFFSPSILAQSSSDLYQKYFQSAGEYRTSHTAYQLAKNQHTQYNTGATQIDAVNKTNSVLLSRNKLHTDYLRYLRAKLGDVTNIADYSQTVVYLDLENEISYLDNWPSQGTGDTFAKINEYSANWEKRLISTDKLVNASQLQIAITTLDKHQTKLQSLLTQYKEKNATPSPDQKITLTQIEGLMGEINTLKNSTLTTVKDYKSSFFSAESLFKNLETAKTKLLDAALLLDEASRNK
jgi:hypothetical protein